MGDLSVNNDKSHFAGTEQQLRKITPKEVHLRAGSDIYCYLKAI